MDSLTATLTLSLTADGSVDVPGFNALSNSSSISARASMTTDAANSALGGGNQAAMYLLQVAASGSASITMASVTNMLLQSTITIARVKGLLIYSLPLVEDATYGTVNTGTTLTCSAAMWWDHSSGHPVFTLKAGEGFAFISNTDVGQTPCTLAVANADVTNAVSLRVGIIGGDD